jgi:hypothetical protein
MIDIGKAKKQLLTLMAQLFADSLLGNRGC